MNNQKVKLFLYFIIGVLSTFLVMYFFNNYRIEKKNDAAVSQNSTSNPQNQNVNFNNSNGSKSVSATGNIEDLTRENIVIDYVKQNHRLPEYYITKSEARNQGWNPSRGNLCDVLPGKAIGGDKFSNREKTLPKGNQYFEADVNYECGHRQADRIVFTKDGEVWLTKDHYKSFQKQ